MNAHDILGVSKDAREDEITAAWRRGMRDAHPDRNGGSTEKAAQLNAARDELLGGGVDAAQAKMRAAALDVMAAYIAKAIKADAKDIAAFIHSEQDTQRQSLEVVMQLAKIERADLEKYRKRYVFQGKGDDAVAASIDHLAESMDKQIAALEAAQAVGVIVGQMVGDYASPIGKPASSRTVDDQLLMQLKRDYFF